MTLHFKSPPSVNTETFTDARAAVDQLIKLYNQSTHFLRSAFSAYLAGELDDVRHRAYYPEIRFRNHSFQRGDSRLSYGHVNQPGLYSTTVTQPLLFAGYFKHQLELLMKNHNESIEIGYSDIPIPVHFALELGSPVDSNSTELLNGGLRDRFDVPDISHVNDYIVNGTHEPAPGNSLPLAPFPAQRVDYSLHRLVHYSATEPKHFQNYVLFTNYQFYIDEFCTVAKALMAKGDSRYKRFVEPGNVITQNGESSPSSGTYPARLPQMPAYHLVSEKGRGITLINIGVGPSNAKTITDHVAVLRPHAWLMLGHCAGLRNMQQLGDYVLAHAYVREDKVLDNDLPVTIPIPALAEIQQALESAVAEVTGLSGFELKSMSQSRAIALDMESATIAANGFRLRVPYGTLLCVSDKPLQGELKLPGMASEFYKNQVAQHLEIGMLSLTKLSQMKPERLHSR